MLAQLARELPLGDYLYEPKWDGFRCIATCAGGGVDLRSRNLTGKAAEEVLQRAHITVNKNTIPGDPQSPFVTSGIRIGTPALTTRGMREGEMKQIARMIDAVLTSPEESTISRVSRQVRDLTAGFPLYARAAAPVP